jgi:uncharacterized membrane protein YphA (DoxX/SURF4 family)
LNHPGNVLHIGLLLPLAALAGAALFVGAWLTNHKPEVT